MHFLNNTKKNINYTKLLIIKGDFIDLELYNDIMIDIKQSNMKIKIEVTDVGRKYYEIGFKYGITDESWEMIKNNKFIFKGPTMMPNDSEHRDLNLVLDEKLQLQIITENDFFIIKSNGQIFVFEPKLKHDIQLSINKTIEEIFNIIKMS